MTKQLVETLFKSTSRMQDGVYIEGPLNVLEACVKNKIKRLIYSSSASVKSDVSSNTNVSRRCD
jgi:nucleoside-diphosphate-sugar epimerase